MRPKFQHDCSRCEFLGTLFDAVDVYVHRNSHGDTLIARYSGVGNDYSSTCDFKNEAVKRIQARIGGIDEFQAQLLALVQLMPSTILNGMAWSDDRRKV